MSGSILRRWLRRHPHPVSVRAISADGEAKIFRLGTTTSKWRDAEEALEPYPRLEALDSTNAILRAFNREDDDADEKKPQDATIADPETARFVAISRLLAEAADKGAARHEAAYKLAFEKLVDLANLFAHRATVYEKAWQQAIKAQLELQAEAAGQQDIDPNTMLVQTALAALPAIMGQGQQGKPPNGQ